MKRAGGSLATSLTLQFSSKRLNSFTAASLFPHALPYDT